MLFFYVLYTLEGTLSRNIMVVPYRRYRALSSSFCELRLAWKALLGRLTDFGSEERRKALGRVVYGRTY